MSDARTLRVRSVRWSRWAIGGGAIVGGVIVLLFTPRTGEEVREAIGEIAHLLRERVRGALTGESSYVADEPATPTDPPG